ncbi:hypothetical protein F66182_828 [Fusarium sp. NRRL 66182]|nr:hypothetical protein F66182_828 [Fusarium sp. NRRL 66182]
MLLPLVPIIGALTALTLANSHPFTLRVAHQQRGILTLSFDPTKSAGNSLEVLTTTPAGIRPGWLHSRGKHLYSVSRTFFPDNSSTSAGIFAFEKQAGGRLRLLDTAVSHGDGGVFVDVSPNGKTLATANMYVSQVHCVVALLLTSNPLSDGSTAAVFPLTSPGSIGDPSHIFQYNLTRPGPGLGTSQIRSNPHAAMFDPSGDILAVPDKGADRLYLYQVHSSQNVEMIRNMTLLPGTGPRHLLFSERSPRKTLMFVVAELDNTINVFSLDHPRKSTDLKKTLKVTHLQSLSTLSDSTVRTEPTGNKTAAEIALSHDERFLYVTNRNPAEIDNIDTLAIYSANLDSNRPLKFMGLNSTYGKIPRHFSLSPDSNSKFAAIAHQTSNNLFVLERDSRTGFFTRVVGNLSFGQQDLTTRVGPVAVIWE